MNQNNLYSSWHPASKFQWTFMKRTRQGRRTRTTQKHNEQKKTREQKNGKDNRKTQWKETEKQWKTWRKGKRLCFWFGVLPIFDWGAPLMKSTLLSKKRSGKRGATNMNQQQTCEGLEEGVPASGSAPGSSSGWINMRYKSMIRNKNGMNYGRVRKPECVRPKENESEWFKISAMWNQESEKGFTGREGLNINGVMRNHLMNLGIAKKILCKTKFTKRGID